MFTLGLLIVELAGCTSPGAFSRAYLPTIGPAPLRFESAQPVIRRPLPPLVIEQPRETADPDDGALSGSTNAPPHATLSPPNPSVPALDLDPHNAATPSRADPTAPILAPFVFPSDTNAPAMISPQMLVRFFPDRVGTNRPPAIAIALPFNPAMPPNQPNPPSSTATYSSPAKP